MEDLFVSSPPRIAFSTLAFPDATRASAAALGRRWGYSGIELRLIDGELIDPSMPAADRVRVKRAVTAAELPVVAVDSSIRLTDDDPGPQLRRFLELASDWESPLVRVFGGPLAAEDPARTAQLQAAARALEASVLEMVESGWVGAVWDSHPPHRMGERPAEVHANLAGRVLLAQVKDARRAPERDDGWQLVLLGQGEVPVQEMIALLAHDGYQGWVSVEWEKRWHPEIEEPEVALPQHRRLLDSWLREPHEAG